jgi:signal transduction histidine kinase
MAVADKACITSGGIASRTTDDLSDGDLVSRLAEAERSNRVKDEFLATLAHELRNPLQAIVGWTTILNRLPDLPERAAQGLATIERNSRIQARMIADVLDYAGIAIGRIRPAPENIDPYAAVRAAIEAMTATAQSAAVSIRSTFDDAALRVDADPARLQQIVQNLLSNAIKFSNKGGEVLVEAGRAGDSFSVVVTDAGEGIEPQLLPRIFERFSQQDGRTRSHGGLGLGLTIVRQLVELHGGTVEASSDGKGRGATFRVVIPQQQSAAAPAQWPARRESP